jgi:HflK protein
MLIALGALVVLNGFYIVGPQEAGVIERLGRRVLPLSDPGLHYKLPWPVDRLTKLAAKRVNVIEVGFRSGATAGDQEPAAYEWNVQHRSGRFQRKPEESLMLSGDQNMIEVNCVIHWALARPDDFLLRQMEGETTVRAAAEAALAAVMSRVSLDAVLTSARATIENAIRAEAQKRLDRYNSGVEVLSARLLDVHPSVEVVDAFREVSAAWEEKNRTINEAEAYRNEQVALARGNGQAKLAGAEGYSVGRKNRATGDADRFKLAEDAFRTAPGPTETRLYLETMEQVLAGRRKLIVDASKGRRHLFLVEDGIEIGPALLAPPRRPGVD